MYIYIYIYIYIYTYTYNYVYIPHNNPAINPAPHFRGSSITGLSVFVDLDYPLFYSTDYQHRHLHSVAYHPCH